MVGEAEGTGGVEVGSVEEVGAGAPVLEVQYTHRLVRGGEMVERVLHQRNLLGWHTLVVGIEHRHHHQAELYIMLQTERSELLEPDNVLLDIRFGRRAKETVVGNELLGLLPIGQRTRLKGVAKALTERVALHQVAMHQVLEDLLGHEKEVEALEAILANRPARIEVHIDGIIGTAIARTDHLQRAIRERQNHTLQGGHIRDIASEEAVVVFETLAGVGQRKSAIEGRRADTIVGIGGAKDEGLDGGSVVLEVGALVGVGIGDVLDIELEGDN